MTNQAQSTNQNTTSNNEVAGFDIHILKDIDGNGSYLKVRVIDTTDFHEAAISALFSENSSDRSDIEDYLKDCATIESITSHKDLLYNEDGISFEIVKIIPLKKIGIQLEYDGAMIDRTILMPINQEENPHNAYFV